MLWVALDIEVCDDPAWLEMEDIDPRAMSRLVRLAQIAKRNDPSGGRICRRDGGPMGALDLARVHERSSDAAPAWERFISEATRLGFLCQVDGYVALTDWDTRWGKKPSDESGAVAERKRLQRERDGLAKERAEFEALKASLQAPPSDVTPCHAPVTPPSQRFTQHSTAQHEHSMPPLTPPPGGAGEGASEEIEGNEGDEGEPKVDSECLRAAQALHGQALPAKAERKIRDEVQALLQAGHPPDAIGAWCRQACEDLRRDPAGLNLPVYGVPRRMHQLAAGPAVSAPSSPGHRPGCGCPVCGIADDIVRWGLRLPMPSGGKPTPAAIAGLEQCCRTAAAERLLPGLTAAQVQAGIVEALHQVTDVAPHVQATCTALADRLSKSPPGRASPSAKRSSTPEPVPAHAG
jgi:hypothetical protein